MVRKLLPTSAVLLTVFPLASWALGLGGISAQSALNEPFFGEIDLREVKRDELDRVKVSLAPQAEFAKMGVPRSHFLTKLRFEPQVSPQGRTIVRVTTSDPVREPYLDFLVEVTWPDGRLVKEYTVLLDPPVTTSRPAPKIEPPAVVQDRPPPRAQRTAKAPRTAGASSVSRDSTGYPLRYGPVKPGAGLLRVARSMAPPGATVPQTATAIYRNNQDAFVGGDINKLKLGAELEIPTRDELFALDAEAADREVQVALAGGKVTAAPLTDVTRAAESTDRLAIAAAPAPADPPAKPPLQAPAEASAEAAGAASGVSGAPLEQVQQELLLVREEGESTRQETQELRARIRELEAQLADIRTLLELSNEQLARIQASRLEGELQSSAEAVDVPLAPEELELPAGTEHPAEAPIEPTETQAELPAPGTKPVETATTPPRRPSEAVQQATPPAEQIDPRFWEAMPATLWAAAVGVPLILLLLGFLVVHRRKRLEESLQSGVFEDVASAPDAEEPSQSQKDWSGKPGLSTAENLEDAQISGPPSGFSRFTDDTEDADIISEADVYITYGRYREAETLLSEGIALSPQSLDLKFKLAEAYFGAKNTNGFRKLVAQMRDAGAAQKDPQQWQRLTSMAQEITGGSRIGDEPAEQDDLAATTSESVGRAGALPSGEPFFDASSEPGFSDLFVTSDDRNESDATELPASSTAQSAAPSAAEQGLAANDSMSVLDLDLDLDIEKIDGADADLVLTTDGTASVNAASDLELELGDLESLEGLDVSSFSGGGPQPSDVVAEQPEALVLPGDRSDTSLISGDTAASDGLSSQWQVESGLWDDVATKIDLARAYIDMQDPEAAKMILEEVVEEGNEEQKAEAKEMLSRLD